MSDYFDRVERQIMQRVETAAPRSWRLPVRLDHLVPAAAVLVVVAVFAVFIGLRGGSPAPSAGAGTSARMVFSASAVDPRAPLGPAVDRAVEILRARLDSVFPGVHVTRAAHQIIVLARGIPGVSRARIVALAAPGQLEFYDWETNALTANGSTVASQLQNQDPDALQISQGSGTSAPGEPGAGSLSLYQAVMLASRQPGSPGAANSRSGPEYFMFGSPGSAACAAAARARAGSSPRGAHCLLSGPTANGRQLLAGLPAGVSPSQAQELIVPAGTVILQAGDTTPARHTSFNDPSDRFYVLHDHPALSGNEILDPRQSTDETGNADVTFAFTKNGETEFEHVTSVLARRGQLVSRPGQDLYQHFAVAIDNQLISVPQIDFKQYPNGIENDTGAGLSCSGPPIRGLCNLSQRSHGQITADLTGTFTVQTARTLVTLLRFGPLPVNLTLR